ncbi:hypothetical protein VZ94_21525 [Methylocucumis oryzae]|uniref:Uncharacterized protein n=1 Tax=Methylocucumis oryzae TaxID=1632867 RepID=A0A0F3IDY4_9GAMM|nr:hypothetical protein VZ94_21525 [Methylocucumis oryzae]
MRIFALATISQQLAATLQAQQAHAEPVPDGRGAANLHSIEPAVVASRLSLNALVTRDVNVSLGILARHKGG